MDTTPQQALHQLIYAASHGDLETLQNASRQDALHLHDYDGRTPLHLACAEGHSEVVQYLVTEVNVDVVCKDRWGNTPHHEASKWRRKLEEQAASEETLKQWDCVMTMLTCER